MFPGRVVLLAKPDRGAIWVDVAVSEVEGALDAGSGLEVEPEEQQVEVRVAASGPDGVGEIAQLSIIHARRRLVVRRGLLSAATRSSTSMPTARASSSRTRARS